MYCHCCECELWDFFTKANYYYDDEFELSSQQDNLYFSCEIFTTQKQKGLKLKIL